MIDKEDGDKNDIQVSIYEEYKSDDRKSKKFKRKIKSFILFIQ